MLKIVNSNNQMSRFSTILFAYMCKSKISLFKKVVKCIQKMYIITNINAVPNYQGRKKEKKKNNQAQLNASTKSLRLSSTMAFFILGFKKKRKIKEEDYIKRLLWWFSSNSRCNLKLSFWKDRNQDKLGIKLSNTSA